MYTLFLTTIYSYFSGYHITSILIIIIILIQWKNRGTNSAMHRCTIFPSFSLQCIVIIIAIFGDAIRWRHKRDVIWQMSSCMLNIRTSNGRRQRGVRGLTPLNILSENSMMIYKHFCVAQVLFLFFLTSRLFS